MDIAYEVGIISLFALFFTFLSYKLKMSPIIGLIITGMIIGPNVLNIVSNEGYINIFSYLGEILLLYYIGSKISIKKIKEIGIKPLIIWMIKAISVFIIIYLFTTILGVKKGDAIIFSSIFMVSSTAFFAKITKEKRIINKKEAQLILVVLLIEDLLSIFLLMVYSGASINSNNIIITIIKSFLLLGFIYYFLSKFILQITNKLFNIKSEEVILFSSLSLAIILSIISKELGLSPGIGAFLAGNLLGSMDKSKKILDHLGLLFTSFFFLSIGMQINPNHVIEYSGLILGLLVVILSTITITIFFSTYLLGFNSKQSTLSTALMLSISEFSLILAKEVSHLMTVDIVSIAGTVVLLGGIIENIGINNYTKINRIIETRIPKSIRKFLKNISVYFGKVTERMKENKKIKNILEEILIIILIILLILYITKINDVSIIITFLISIIIIYKLIELFKEVSKNFYYIVDKHDLNTQAIIFFTLILILLIFSIILILIIHIFDLNKIFFSLILIPLFLIATTIYNLGKIAKKLLS